MYDFVTFDIVGVADSDTYYKSCVISVRESAILYEFCLIKC